MLTSRLMTRLRSKASITYCRVVKHYPQLYLSTSIPCPIRCKDHPDTNEHLGFCLNLRPFINLTLQQHKTILINLLIRFILTSVNNFGLFTPVDNNTHVIYLILRQLVLQHLTKLTHSYINKHLFMR